MSVWMPTFYPDFRCRAGACGHSCCKGWEIDVDESSAARYRALPGTLGEELRAALICDAEGWHFRLTEQERCPFLQPDGLCRLIRELGEDALCDICALHPRFFQSWGEDELWGVGLSCEAAAALLLERELRFSCPETGETRTFPELLERLGIAFPPELLRCRVRVNGERKREVLSRFRDTEPIDEHWPQELDTLAAAPLPPEEESPKYQRVYEYILYRQIERMEEVPPRQLAAYARLSTDLIALWDALEPDTAEHLRRWSEQIEYSTENVDRLLAAQASSDTAS